MTIKNTNQKVGKDYGKSYKPWNERKLNIMTDKDRKKAVNDDKDRN